MRSVLYATSVAVVATFLCTPASAQRGSGMATDTTGAGGAPSLRALVRAASDESGMQVVMQRFTADRAALGRRYDIPLSPVLHARQRAFYEGWLRSIDAVDAGGLNARGREDHAALRAQIAAGLAAVAAEERQREAVAPLLPFLRTVQLLQEQRRDRLPIKSMQTAQTINDVMKEVKRLTADVEKAGPLPGSMRDVSAADALRAAALIAPAPAGDSAKVRRGAAGALRTMLQDWFTYFNGYDPLFTWWVHKPYEELNTALDAYSAAITKRWRPSM